MSQLEKEVTEKIKNVLNFTDDVEVKRSFYTSPTALLYFDRGVSEVGAQKFIEVLNNVHGNIYQAVAIINGCKNIVELVKMDGKKKANELKLKRETKKVVINLFSKLKTGHRKELEN